MSAENNSAQYLSKKAHEIAYALFRIAANVSRPDRSSRGSFGDHLENKGLALLSVTVAEDYAGSRIVSRGIEYLLRFGVDVGAVNAANSQTVIQELRTFNSAIAELEKAATAVATMPEVNLGNVFSKLSLPVRNPKNVDNHDDNHAVAANYSNGNGNGNHSAAKAAMRQTAILERIRQNGNCRLKDVQDILPEISERTIRYDLQNLVEQGLVERIGSGGPATSYRVK